jgi:dienelactone hydrolase
MWFGSLVDRWDEEAAAEDDSHKLVEVFAVGASLAFPVLPPTADHFALANTVHETMADPLAFYAVDAATDGVIYRHRWLAFPSAIQTEDPINDVARAFILESDWRGDAVLLIPHWNAPQQPYMRFARVLHRMGYTAAVLILPYHHHRKRSESMIADHFVSANLGRTIRAVRQSVVDARGIIDWLEARGHTRFHVVGASVGSCVAGLVGACDKRVRSTVLLLTAGSFADAVWTGRATRHIAAAFQGSITLERVRAIWSIISLDQFIEYYRRPSHDLLILSANRDTVILPNLTNEFVGKLCDAKVAFQHATFSCGHYSIGMLPFSILAVARALSFLRRVSR